MTVALRLALALFGPEAVSHDQIEQNCEDVLTMLRARGADVPPLEALVREVESRVIVVAPEGDIIHDQSPHVPWIAEREIEWRFWDRYRRYLEQVEMLPPAVIARMDDSTSRVLDQLEPPDRLGEWDRRGLVVGQVQSGKTGHYTGLACKAADTGYKLIVVLAGLHNSLRSQTQLRLDEGLLGFDTQFQFRADDQASRKIGVGALPGVMPLPIGSYTTSREAGDFKKALAQAAAIPLGSMPILLVVKKNASILRNLYKWLTALEGEKVEGAHKGVAIKSIPLLLIDDEADHASVNTNDEDENPATINGLIRDLLAVFEKSAYVGYTATPFANIFADDELESEHGQDIFPRNFIESLKPPSNYFGPERVFGLSSDDEPLPVFRAVDDHKEWLPDKHKKDWRLPKSGLPASLEEALNAFFLSCAARAARGQTTAHNSMLVHATSFQNVQEQVAKQIEDYLLQCKYRLKYGDGSGPSLRDALQYLWETDFKPCSQFWGDEVVDVTWAMIDQELTDAVTKIQMRTINGSSADALEYFENRRNGLSLIAVGGNKLSRGLTLEGLTVSYFLRASRMYDTLMQMGRWFGYRPGYEDLCRLYTTDGLRAGYREIAAAMDELRRDFEDMAARGATPADYGLRIRQSEAGFIVTSPAKMRQAKSLTLSYSESNPQTVTFDLSERAVDGNLAAVGALVAACAAEPAIVSNNFVWRNVGAQVVLDFLAAYEADGEAKRARPQMIAAYIRECLKIGDLSSWTVAVISNSAPRARKSDAVVPGKQVALTVRVAREQKEDLKHIKRYTIPTLLSPRDESLDLDASALARAREQAFGERVVADQEVIPPTFVRAVRHSSQGLLVIYPIDPMGKAASNSKAVRAEAEEDRGERLDGKPLIGFAFSLPKSEGQIHAKWLADKRWYEQMMMWNDEDL